MQKLLVTNNILAENAYKNVCQVETLDVDYKGVLLKVRDYIHSGYLLLTHPLSGSVKPNENPFKSVLLAIRNGDTDLDSLRIIENAIATAEKFSKKYKIMNEVMKADFAKIDCSLITSIL